MSGPRAYDVMYVYPPRAGCNVQGTASRRTLLNSLASGLGGARSRRVQCHVHDIVRTAGCIGTVPSTTVRTVTTMSCTSTSTMALA